MLELKRLRKERDMRQIDLSHRSGISQAHISRLESGVQGPGPQTLLRLAWVLQVDPAELCSPQTAATGPEDQTA